MSSENAVGVVVGVGASSGVAEQEVRELIAAALAEAELPVGTVRLLATVEARAGEPGLLGAARELGVPLVGHPAAALAAVPVPSPSGEVLDAVGTASVAEAAALLGGGELLVGKRKSARSTVAVATLPSHDLRHHGDAEVRDANLVDLAVNVRTGTPPQWLRSALADTLGELAAYPEQTTARAAVAARHRRPVEEVLLTSGAAEAFVLLARTLRPQHAVVVHPQFTEPEAALRDAGIPVHRVLLRAADGFRLTAGAVPEQADLVVIGNPTNPTSVLHPAAVLAELARPGRTLVVDEAFMDTVPGETESLASLSDLPGRVVVLRSLTKTWGLAGLRIGYVLGPAPLIAELGAAQPLWPVSTPALRAAELCSGERALTEAEAAAAELTAHRAHLLGALAGFPSLRVHGEPAASFVLIELPQADRVRDRLRAEGFAVRRGDTFPGLGPDWLRIAVRAPQTTDAFVAALRRVLGDTP